MSSVHRGSHGARKSESDFPARVGRVVCTAGAELVVDAAALTG